MPYAPETEEADIARVEEILDAAVARNPRPTGARSDTKPLATRAVWLCACTSEDGPFWLIYQTPDDEIAWQRVPSRVDMHDLVSASRWAGGHVSPDEVRLWLEGADDPWSVSSYVTGSPTVLSELARRIRGA